MKIKPNTMDDADLKYLKYWCFQMPKIDGVRSWNPDGTLLGRSMNPHENLYVTQLFSKPQYVGLDGEMVTVAPNRPDCCRITSGDLRRIKGEPNVCWFVFDLIDEESIRATYKERLLYLELYVYSLEDERVQVMPWMVVESEEEFLAIDAELTANGMEGSIYRDPEGLYKEGRSTSKEATVVRLKGFVTEEALVVGIIEGQENQNPAKKNALGRTERSTCAEFMVPNGKIGSLICIKVPSVSEPWPHLSDITEEDKFIVSAGAMPHDERERLFQHPEEILWGIIEFKHFPKGRKDKPRFPTFKRIRPRSDIE